VVNRASGCIAIVALSGCHWALPAVPDTGVDVAMDIVSRDATDIEDVPVDARDVMDANDVVDVTDVTDVADVPGDAPDVLVDVPQDTESSCLLLADMTAMRVAHVSTELPQLDFCIKLPGEPDSAYTGPVLQRFGVTYGGLGYPQLSGYLPVLPGDYTVRIVNAAAPDGSVTDCTMTMPNVSDQDVTFLPRTYTTMVVVGTSATGFRVQTYNDTHDAYSDGAPVGNPRVRMIHLSPSAPRVQIGPDFTILGSDTFIELAAASYLEVGEMAMGMSSNAHDCNGYYAITVPVPRVYIYVLEDANTSNRLLSFPIMLPPGALVSAFLIGQYGVTSGPDALETLLCNDATSSGGLTTCVVNGYP
jgi:hypothetical protein